MTFTFSNSFNVSGDAHSNSVLNLHIFQPFIVWRGRFYVLEVLLERSNVDNAFQVFGMEGATGGSIEGGLI